MSDKNEKQAISEEHKTVLRLVRSLEGRTDMRSFIIINYYGNTLEHLLNALKYYKGHLEREGTTKDDVIKAMKTIREWCESHPLCEYCMFSEYIVDGLYCTFKKNPCSWEIDE